MGLRTNCVQITKHIRIKVVRINFEGGLSVHGGGSDLYLELSKHNPVAKNRFLMAGLNSPSGFALTQRLEQNPSSPVFKTRLTVLKPMRTRLVCL